MVDNSFFEIDYTGKRAALFVPHQDDETNLFPSLLSALSSQGTEVFVVYMTNGDWKLPAKKRFEEALLALSLLGIKEDHVIFMGYGDGLNDPSRSHMFYAKNEPAVSPAGHDHTYGTDDHPDYAFSRRGEHSPYTRKAYTEDLKAVMLELKADLLLCNDLDQHADHRMLSICFDEALGRILKEVPDYRPEVIKGFAYATAYTAEPDLFSGLNMPETKRPEAGKTAQYQFDILGTSYYDWEGRVRLPLVPEARSLSLGKNLIARALRCHRSQQILRRADRIINSDEVGFKRRTDSLSYTARVTASSGDPSKLNDFMVFDTGDIDAEILEPGNCFWTPDAGDRNACARFDWDSPQTVSEIVIYGNYSCDESASGRIENIRVSFDNGFSLMSGPLPENGRALRLSFVPQESVRSCTLSVTDASGSGWGIAECELYGGTERFLIPAPFIKITADGDPAYDYLIGPGRSEAALDVYKYGCEAPARLYVAEGKAEIKGGRLIMDPEEKTVTIRAELMNGETVLTDEVMIRRISSAESLKKKLSVMYNKGMIKALKIKRRVSLGLKRRLRAVVKG